MGYNAAPLERLIEQFAKLPGIGRKGATRLAYQVLSMDKEEALDFARAIEEAHTKIHRCRVCQNFTEDEICAICTGEARDHSAICVVENPRDVTAFERTREYRGAVPRAARADFSDGRCGAQNSSASKSCWRVLQAGECKRDHYGDQPHGGGGGDSHVCGEACQASGRQSHAAWPMACPWAATWSMPMR